MVPAGWAHDPGEVFFPGFALAVIGGFVAMLVDVWRMPRWEVREVLSQKGYVRLLRWAIGQGAERDYAGSSASVRLAAIGVVASALILTLSSLLGSVR